jgi:DNA polymerase-3 subunit alpha
VESYQSLYLKAYYPLEYMTACINNFGGYYRTEVYVHEARKWGAEILAPSINEGEIPCVLRDKKLILGFILVEGIETHLIHSIIQERKQHGKFTDFENLIQRIHIPLEQLTRIIRINALRDFPETRKQLLWKAQLVASKVQKHREPTLFEPTKQQVNFPVLEENSYELAFEQLELLGFPLCNPFELLGEVIPTHTPARLIPQSLGLKITTYGYLVALKNSTTQTQLRMSFGSFIDQHGELIDTVHFPETLRKYPFYGKGIYELTGIVSVEFNYYTLEVGYMRKLPFMEDMRFSEQSN